jgi:hypothetical protein
MGADIHHHSFLTSDLDGGERSTSRSGRFFRGNNPCTHLKGGFTGPKAGLGDLENEKFLPLPGLEYRFL